MLHGVQCISAGARLIKAEAVEGEEGEETYQDVLDDMEDFWQRDGVPPCAPLAFLIRFCYLNLSRYCHSFVGIVQSHICIWVRLVDTSGVVRDLCLSVLSCRPCFKVFCSSQVLLSECLVWSCAIHKVVLWREPPSGGTPRRGQVAMALRCDCFEAL